MHIQYSNYLGLGEFERAALKQKFVYLVEVGELRPHPVDNAFYLTHGEPENLYVLAPNLVLKECTSVQEGWIIMTAAEWNL